MALSDMQVRQLRAKLEPRHVKTRKANGADLHYVEGVSLVLQLSLTRVSGMLTAVKALLRADPCVTANSMLAPLMAI